MLRAGLPNGSEGRPLHRDHGRYHESLGNVPPADAYFGRGQAILNETRKIKEKTMKQRRLINQKRAA